MSKTHKLLTVLVVVLIAIGTLAAVLVGGSGFGSVAAATDQLEAAKYVSSPEVAPGQTLQYMVVLTNTSGATLSNVRVGDTLDDDLTYVVDSDTYDPPGTPGYDGVVINNTITFTIATMAPDDVVTITFDVDLDGTAVPDTTIDNTARIYSDTTYVGDSNPVSFSVSPTPELQIYSPESGSTVTDRPDDVLEISGRVWAQFNPAPFPDVPVLEDISNFGGVGNYTVEWNAIADAANYVLQESTKADFSSFTTYGVAAPNANQFIAGKGLGTYYYRVAAYNAQGRPSRWSNVESVTVTSGAAQAAAEVGASVLGIDDLNVVAQPTVEVEVSTDGGSTWDSAAMTVNPGGWWDWTYDWTLPEGDGIDYPIMARASYPAGGDYGTDMVTVTLQNSTVFVYLPIMYKYWPPVPYAPTLNDIQQIGGDVRDLRVTWSYYDGVPSIPDPIDYQLQVATDEAFTQNLQTHTTAVTTWDLLDVDGGTYYFRVRGRNNFGYGPWSVVKTRTVTVSSYEFETGVEGWAITRSDEGEGQQLPAPVMRDGKLYHLVWGKADFSILSPMEQSPAVPYTINARVDIVDGETIDGKRYQPLQGMTYGIIFGGNDANPCPADRNDPNGCLNHYYRLLVSYDMGEGSLKYELKRIDYHEGDSGGGAGRGVALVSWRDVSGVSYGATDWNNWRIEVTDASKDNIKIYFNDKYQAAASDRNFINDRYFGTFLYPTNELGGVATKWEYFRVQ